MNILWDLDGTLFNTYPTIINGIQKAANRKLDEQKLLSLLKINSYVAFEYFNLGNDVREGFKNIERGIHPKEKPPFPSILEVLENSQLNVIVTHKDRKSVDALLTYWNMEHLFSEVLCLEDDNYKRKPESDSYEYLHNKYGIDLVVGDRELDFIPANKLGIPTCCYQNLLIEADFHIDNYKHFPTKNELSQLQFKKSL